MADVDFLNANSLRAYPFFQDTELELLQPGRDEPVLLPNDVIVEFRSWTESDALYSDGFSTVYLHSITRIGNIFTFEFRSTAAGLVNYALRFQRHRDEADHVGQFVDCVRIAGEDTSICPGGVRWEGYLVTGRLQTLSEQLPDGSVWTAAVQGLPILPTLTHNLLASRVRALHLANRNRTHALPAAGCPPLTATPDDNAILVNATCVDGDVVCVDGYNLVIQQSTADRTLTLNAGVGRGEGEPCEEVPLVAGETSPDGGRLLTGGPACNELIKSINGVLGPQIRIIGGQGVRVKQPPTDPHKLIVDVDMHDMTICTLSPFDSLSSSYCFAESSSSYSSCSSSSDGQRLPAEVCHWYTARYLVQVPCHRAPEPEPEYSCSAWSSSSNSSCSYSYGSSVLSSSWSSDSYSWSSYSSSISFTEWTPGMLQLIRRPFHNAGWAEGEAEDVADCIVAPNTGDGRVNRTDEWEFDCLWNFDTEGMGEDWDSLLEGHLRIRMRYVTARAGQPDASLHPGLIYLMFRMQAGGVDVLNMTADGGLWDQYTAFPIEVPVDTWTWLDIPFPTIVDFGGPITELAVRILRDDRQHASDGSVVGPPLTAGEAWHILEVDVAYVELVSTPLHTYTNPICRYTPGGVGLRHSGLIVGRHRRLYNRLVPRLTCWAGFGTFSYPAPCPEPVDSSVYCYDSSSSSSSGCSMSPSGSSDGSLIRSLSSSSLSEGSFSGFSSSSADLDYAIHRPTDVGYGGGVGDMSPLLVDDCVQADDAGDRLAGYMTSANFNFRWLFGNLTPLAQTRPWRFRVYLRCRQTGGPGKPIGVELRLGDSTGDVLGASGLAPSEWQQIDPGEDWGWEVVEYRGPFQQLESMQPYDGAYLELVVAKPASDNVRFEVDVVYVETHYNAESYSSLEWDSSAGIYPEAFSALICSPHLIWSQRYRHFKFRRGRVAGIPTYARVCGHKLIQYRYRVPCLSLSVSSSSCYGSSSSSLSCSSILNSCSSGSSSSSISSSSSVSSSSSYSSSFGHTNYIVMRPKPVGFAMSGFYPTDPAWSQHLHDDCVFKPNVPDGRYAYSPKGTQGYMNIALQRDTLPYGSTFTIDPALIGLTVRRVELNMYMRMTEADSDIGPLDFTPMISTDGTLFDPALNVNNDRKIYLNQYNGEWHWITLTWDINPAFRRTITVGQIAIGGTITKGETHKISINPNIYEKGAKQSKVDIDAIYAKVFFEEDEGIPPVDRCAAERFGRTYYKKYNTIRKFPKGQVCRQISQYTRSSSSLSSSSWASYSSESDHVVGRPGHLISPEPDWAAEYLDDKIVYPLKTFEGPAAILTGSTFSTVISFDGESEIHAQLFSQTATRLKIRLLCRMLAPEGTPGTRNVRYWVTVSDDLGDLSPTAPENLPDWHTLTVPDDPGFEWITLETTATGWRAFEAAGDMVDGIDIRLALVRDLGADPGFMAAPLEVAAAYVEVHTTAAGRKYGVTVRKPLGTFHHYTQTYRLVEEVPRVTHGCVVKRWRYARSCTPRSLSVSQAPESCVSSHSSSASLCSSELSSSLASSGGVTSVSSSSLSSSEAPGWVLQPYLIARGLLYQIDTLLDPSPVNFDTCQVAPGIDPGASAVQTDETDFGHYVYFRTQDVVGLQAGPGRVWLCVKFVNASTATDSNPINIGVQFVDDAGTVYAPPPLTNWSNWPELTPPLLNFTWIGFDLPAMPRAFSTFNNPGTYLRVEIRRAIHDDVTPVDDPQYSLQTCGAYLQLYPTTQQTFRNYVCPAVSEVDYVDYTLGRAPLKYYQRKYQFMHCWKTVLRWREGCRPNCYETVLSSSSGWSAESSWSLSESGSLVPNSSSSSYSSRSQSVYSVGVYPSVLHRPFASATTLGDTAELDYTHVHQRLTQPTIVTERSPGWTDAADWDAEFFCDNLERLAFTQPSGFRVWLLARQSGPHDSLAVGLRLVDASGPRYDTDMSTATTIQPTTCWAWYGVDFPGLDTQFEAMDDIVGRVDVLLSRQALNAPAGRLELANIYVESLGIGGQSTVWQYHGILQGCRDLRLVQPRGDKYALVVHHRAGPYWYPVTRKIPCPSSRSSSSCYSSSSGSWKSSSSYSSSSSFRQVASAAASEVMLPYTVHRPTVAIGGYTVSGNTSGITMSVADAINDCVLQPGLPDQVIAIDREDIPSVLSISLQEFNDVTTTWQPGTIGRHVDFIRYWFYAKQTGSTSIQISPNAHVGFTQLWDLPDPLPTIAPGTDWSWTSITMGAGPHDTIQGVNIGPTLAVGCALLKPPGTNSLVSLGCVYAEVHYTDSNPSRSPICTRTYTIIDMHKKVAHLHKYAIWKPDLRRMCHYW